MELIAYPSQGGYRRLRSGFKKRIGERIGESRWVEGEALLGGGKYAMQRGLVFEGDIE